MRFLHAREVAALPWLAPTEEIVADTVSVHGQVAVLAAARTLSSTTPAAGSLATATVYLHDDDGGWRAVAVDVSATAYPHLDILPDGDLLIVGARCRRYRDGSTDDNAHTFDPTGARSAWATASSTSAWTMPAASGSPTSTKESLATSGGPNRSAPPGSPGSAVIVTAYGPTPHHQVPPRSPTATPSTSPPARRGSTTTPTSRWSRSPTAGPERTHPHPCGVPARSWSTTTTSFSSATTTTHCASAAATEPGTPSSTAA